MKLSADWKDASGVFTPLELQVIALAVASPGECVPCGAPDSTVRRLGRWVARAFALHIGAPLANPRLEALRQLACSSFAGNGAMAACKVEAARAAGLSERHIDTLGGMAAGWRVGR